MQARGALRRRLDSAAGRHAALCVATADAIFVGGVIAANAAAAARVAVSLAAAAAAPFQQRRDSDGSERAKDLWQ